MKWNANPQHLTLTILCGAALLLLAACQQDTITPGKQQALGEVIAEVAEQRFYEDDIDHEILTLPDSMQHVMADPIARAKVLNVMLKRAAIAQKARDMGLNLDPVIAYRMRQAEDSVLIDSVRQWQSRHATQPSIEAITAYYQQHQAELTISEQMHARHILVADKKQALDILKQLRNDPQLFSGLAAHHSIDDGNKARGGDLNWFGRGVMVSKFEAEAFKLNEQQRLSQPVKTEFGWHIIEWLGQRPAHMPNLAETRDEIISILKQQQLDTWIDEVMQQTSIQIFKTEYHIPK